MKKKTQFISVCNQKGGVGKTTYTVLLASVLHYKMGKNVLIIDGDYPQWSIVEQRERELSILEKSDYYKLLMLRQYEASGQKIYPILSEKSENAVAAAMRFIGQQQQVDVVLFDLPGTINSLGVFKTLSAMDYVFVPMKADKIVMESTITFARTINESMVTNRDLNTKEIYLFWTMIDKRERTPLYDQYDKVLAAFSLKRLSTHIPLRSKFNKEIMGAGAVYRSTIFAPDNAFTKECHLEVLASEICTILNQ